MKIIFCFLIISSSHFSLLKEDSNASFESGILKLVNSPTNDDPRSPDSLEGSLEYKPFQSLDVQALLLPSHPRPPSRRDNKVTPPVRSLSHNFRRQPPSLPKIVLYQEFLTFAKEATRYLPCDLSSTTNEKEFKARELLNKLKELIYTLPEPNQLTLARLMYHLNR